jgi:glycosyltransferase involved in cell wall biosynthesis
MSHGDNTVGRLTWVDPINNNPHFVDLVAGVFVARGHEITIYSNARKQFDIPRGVTWKAFSSHEPVSPSPTLNALQKLRLLLGYHTGWLRTIRDLRGTRVKRILFSSSLRLPSLDAIYIRRLRNAGIETVFLMHRPFYGLSLPRGRRHKAIKTLMELCPAILVMSKYAAELATSHYSQRADKFIRFSHPHYRAFLARYEVNTATLRQLQSWCGTAPVVLYMSHLLPSNGVADLADAVPAVHSVMPECHFLFVGNDLKNGTSSLAMNVKDRFSSDRRVRCQFGFYEYGDARAFLACASVLAVPYHDIVQSGVVPMAAGEGVPSVVTRVGGLPEMIAPGRSGELADVRNALDLAEKLCRVVSRPAHYRRETLKAATELFSPDQCYEVIASTLSGRLMPRDCSASLG